MRVRGQEVTVHRLDARLKPIKIWELPDDRYQTFMEGSRRRIKVNQIYLQNQYSETTFPDLSNEPRLQNYATVVVGGKVVATIDNQGGVESSDALGQRLRFVLKGDVNGTNGPDLAQVRAEQIARMTGGQVVRAETAITQHQFNTLPSIASVTTTVDYAAMRQDPMYANIQSMIEQLQNTERMRAEYLAGRDPGLDIEA